VQWDAKGDIFQVYVYSSNGALAGVAANQLGAGKGQSFQPKSGSYYLQINGVGNWNVKVVPIR
jgi:hypothetical protein